MHKLWTLVTSSKYLIYFEAAARLESMTRAAEELNVQQPAVSTAIKQLEASLGVLLFRREHKKIKLTTAGSRLYADVSRAFDDILTSANSIRQLTKNDHVTLNASTAFNHYWMMPRLQDLHQRHSHIDLRLQSSDREPDIDSENISLAIRRGTGEWTGCRAALVAREVIYPVASPTVLQSQQDLFSVAALLNQRLIHLEEPIRKRPGWQQWFAQFGVPSGTPNSGLRLNDYALVLQAAMAGEGFAFGWDHLTGPLIRQGLLAAKREWAWETGYGFYLVWSRSRPLSSDAIKVRDWILDAIDYSED